MEIFQIVSVTKDILLAVAGITTASVAIIGLRRWQHEMKGKAEFETARKFAQSTYRVRENVRNCRIPLVTSAEFPSGYVGTGSSTPKGEAEAWAHVFRNRWKPLIESVQEFDASALEAEALWGSDVRSRSESLRACLRKLSTAADAIIDNHLNEGRDFRQDRDFGVEMRKIAFASSSDEKNPFTVELNSAITAIENKLRPHLNRR